MVDCVVCICNSFCEISFASCLLFFFNVKPFSFIRCIDVRSPWIRSSVSKYEANVSPCKCLLMSKKSVSYNRRANQLFRVFVKNPSNSNSLFEKNLHLLNLLDLSSEYGIECFVDNLRTVVWHQDPLLLLLWWFEGLSRFVSLRSDFLSKAILLFSK